MEWASDKKIIKWIALWLGIGGILLFSFVAISFHSEYVKRGQLKQILIAHPELESELVEQFYNEEDEWNTEVLNRILEEKYGYSIWNAVFSRNNISIWVVIYCCVSACFVCVFCLNERKKKLRMQEEMNRLLWFQETVERLQRNDFEIPPYEPCSDKQGKLGSYEETELWNIICDRMIELGTQLETVKERLAEEENNTKSFITNLSHQLKTPLASLKISHELAASNRLTKDEQESFFKQEEVEIEKISSLFDELVKLSRMENHMIHIIPKKAGIKETIVQAVNQVYKKAYQKSIEIQVEMEQDYEVVHDRTWTAEALVNVLDNAIKYSPKNRRVMLRLQKLSMNLLIEIEDEGIGIPSEELHKVFQRFYRGTEAAKFAAEGAGVGLALARNIIEQQGGSITAKRKLENGTIFRIILPL